jgi:hypothetical protein
VITNKILKKNRKTNEYIFTKEEPNTKSAPLNARMMTNIHVSLAWMPVKALLAHGRAISAGTSKNIGEHGGNTFNAAAPSESREGSAFNPLWVTSAPRRKTNKQTPN